MPKPAKITMKETTPGEIMTRDIPQGTWFTGTLKHNDNYVNKLFVKSYDHIFCVHDNIASWDTNIPIINYRPVTVSITVD